MVPSLRVAETSVIDDVSVAGPADSDSCLKTSQDILGKFVEEWLETLDREEVKSLSCFLCYRLECMFFFTQTKAAEYAAAMVKKNERTVR